MKTLDTRDLQERQAELQEEKDSLEAGLEEAMELYSDLLSVETCDIEAGAQEEAKGAAEAARTALNEWLEENQEELTELDTLESEIGSKWVHGETLIPESGFVEYCQDLLSDIGGLPRDIPSYIVIDWDATADNLRVDYSEADYQGTTYLFRMS